jgi:DNA-binding CsgD family transcriptional regulator
MPLVNATCLEQDDFFQEIYQLWDELADFGPPDIDKALRHCMQTLCELTGADDAFWFGIVRHDPDCNPVRGRRSGAYYDLGVKPHSTGDPLDGWRTGAMERLHPVTTAKEVERYKAMQNLDDPAGDTTRAVVSQVGRFRIHHLRSGKLVDLETFQQSQHYDFFYRQTNVNDRLWVVFPVTPNTESCFVIDKVGEGRSFLEDEIRVAGQYLRGLKWFHRQALISHGLGVSPVSLTPTEHRVLCSLLAGYSEKEIATQLEITPGSAHQYCVNIYNKYDVSSRTKLMALWLSSSEK